MVLSVRGVRRVTFLSYQTDAMSAAIVIIDLRTLQGRIYRVSNSTSGK